MQRTTALHTCSMLLKAQSMPTNPNYTHMHHYTIDFHLQTFDQQHQSEHTCSHINWSDKEPRLSDFVHLLVHLVQMRCEALLAVLHPSLHVRSPLAQVFVHQQILGHLAHKLQVRDADTVTAHKLSVFEKVILNNIQALLESCCEFSSLFVTNRLACSFRNKALHIKFTDHPVLHARPMATPTYNPPESSTAKVSWKPIKGFVHLGSRPCLLWIPVVFEVVFIAQVPQNRAAEEASRLT